MGIIMGTQSGAMEDADACSGGALSFSLVCMIKGACLAGSRSGTPGPAARVESTLLG
jgi:hypothetical protein